MTSVFSLLDVVSLFHLKNELFIGREGKASKDSDIPIFLRSYHYYNLVLHMCLELQAVSNKHCFEFDTLDSPSINTISTKLLSNSISIHI